MRVLVRLVLGLALFVFSTAAASAADPLGKDGQGKLSFAMHRIASAAEAGRPLPLRGMSFVNARTGRVSAVIELADGATVDDVRAAVTAVGGDVQAVAEGRVKVSVSARSLRSLAADRSVRRVREPYYPNEKRKLARATGRATTGAVVSEGVALIRADEYRARTGATGAGVAVAVLDAGFDGAEDLVGTELGADTRASQMVLENLGNFGSSHGTACAEIVQDVAPDALLYLSTFQDDVTWSAALDEIAGLGITIVSHSIGFDNLAAPDGNNFWARKVDEVAARGVLVVTAAGNEVGKYVSTTWRDGDGDRMLEFANGQELMGLAVGAPGSRIILRWDDRFGASSHDYDLLVVREGFLANPVLSPSNPEIVAVSANLQRGTQDPLEIASVEVDDDEILYAVVVHDPATPLLSTQRFFVYAPDGVDPSLATSAQTLTLPGDARNAVTVGAVDWETLAVEGFSSRGPTSDGRTKPDLVGPDKVTTVSEAPFYGTSAATPHVAGAAALLLSRAPSMSATALRQALERATNPGGTKNNDFGLGIIDLGRAQ